MRTKIMSRQFSNSFDGDSKIYFYSIKIKKESSLSSRKKRVIVLKPIK